MRQFSLSFLLVLLLVACTDAEQHKVSTASTEVIVLDSVFPMPGLNRTRQVRLYLPPGYQTSEKRYPVLYMHDGQNVFDQATSFAGEWGVDESLNELAAANQLELIVVAIDNGGEKRMTELNPADHPQYGQAEGKAYIEFIVGSVKPYIDQHFRTLADVNHTGIMGSSMGGLISHYAVVQFPEVFGKAGIFSPSYWASGAKVSWFENQRAATDALLYFYMGEEEGESMVPDVQRVYQSVLAKGHPAKHAQFHLKANADHNEAAWRAEFKAAVLWLFNNK